MPENIITETLNSNYEEGKFTRFIDNLLYEADFEKAQQISPLPSEFKDFIKSVKRICKYEYESPEYGGSKVIDVLTVKLKRTSSIERARTAQRNFVARYLNGGRGYPKDAALVAFISEDENGNVSPDWRFSFVQMSYETKLPEKPGEQLKTRQEITPAKRFSFLVGANEHTHTAQRQLEMLFDKAAKKQKITTEDISAAFDIEIVSKEFFDKYKELFIKLKDELQRLCDSDEKIRRDFSKHKINIEDFAKKTLGQLVFLYFIQKKGWLGVKLGGKWGSGDRKFLRNVFERKYCDYHNFFNDVLEHLFYEALATDRTAENDLFKMLDCRIPFLNGGLFEPVNGYDWRQTNLTIDNRIFRDIFDVFDLYNFTVKEDEPLEKEVAIDPEMLGKVFENLLPENLRKGNGAYYTPREIVHYMCQQSLISYLYGRIINKAKEIVSKDDLEIFVKRGSSVYENRRIKVRFDLPQSIINNASLLDTALAEIRICDPAIGSGAFPVGMMNEIVRAREALNAHIGQPERSAYSLKRNAIENCLYGVDLDGGAVEIAKLRLWLSLVVDEENINEIKPLPNLDYKIMQGNSLISTYEGMDFDDIVSEQHKDRQIMLFEQENESVIDKITKKQKELLNSPGQCGKAIKQEIEELIVELVKAHYEGEKKLVCSLVNFYEDKIRNFAQNRENRNFFPWKLFFADIFAQGGFDVVIGNPPYIQLQDNQGFLGNMYKDCGYAAFAKTGDIYCLFYERGLQLLKPQCVLCFITSNKWMRAGYGEKLRSFFVKNAKARLLIDFAGVKIFENATVDTNILLLQKTSNNQNTKDSTMACTAADITKDGLFNLGDFVKQHSCPIMFNDSDAWVILSPIEQNIKAKIEKYGTPLKNWDISICRGILTGCNEAFIITTEKKNQILASCKTSEEYRRTVEILRPILRGRDIKRYSYDWADLWLINTHNGIKEKGIPPINIEEYPAIKAHLDEYWDKISKRADKGDTPYNLRNCAYIDVFNKPKIIYPETTQGAYFVLDKSGILIDKTCFMLISEYNDYLQKTLSSKLFEFAYKRIFSSIELGENGYQYNKHALLKLPVIVPEKGFVLPDNNIDKAIYTLYGISEEEQCYIESQYKEERKIIEESVN